MTKRVTSTDPRKPAIVAKLKAASGGTKVTNVFEHRDGSFTGDCMTKQPGERQWTNLGQFEIRTGRARKAPEVDEIVEAADVAWEVHYFISCATVDDCPEKPDGTEHVCQRWHEHGEGEHIASQMDSREAMRFYRNLQGCKAVQSATMFKRARGWERR